MGSESVPSSAKMMVRTPCAIIAVAKISLVSISLFTKNRVQNGDDLVKTTSKATQGFFSSALSRGAHLFNYFSNIIILREIIENT